VGVSEFDGLVAVVTGGASGIGAATVQLLSERGAKVAVLDLNAAAENELSVVFDVTDDAFSQWLH
jgi:2-keto-3-deoxy-L-fuconate dehydrogenase